MIVWLTGQPGSGKTTLSNKLLQHLDKSFQIDGDNLREICDNFDYNLEGRKKNIENAIVISKYLDYNNYNVLISLVAPYRDMREKLKKTNNVLEVYLHTDEIRGREKYFPTSYEPPLTNYIDLDTGKLSIEECVTKILEKIIK